MQGRLVCPPGAPPAGYNTGFGPEAEICNWLPPPPLPKAPTLTVPASSFVLVHYEKKVFLSIIKYLCNLKSAIKYLRGKSGVKPFAIVKKEIDRNFRREITTWVCEMKSKFYVDTPLWERRLVIL